jgi:hypothetical protein
MANNKAIANARQVAGTHYKRSGAVEHWDIVAQHGLDYFQGQITKYVMRHKYKNGLQDLQKAQHFLEKYIELQTAPAPAPAPAEAEQLDLFGPTRAYVQQDA